MVSALGIFTLLLGHLLSFAVRATVFIPVRAIAVIWQHCSQAGSFRHSSKPAEVITKSPVYSPKCGYHYSKCHVLLKKDHAR
jgi:hypothetical protein